MPSTSRRAAPLQAVAFLTAALLAAALAGCTSGGQTPKAEESSPTPATTSQTPVTTEGPATWPNLPAGDSPKIDYLDGRVLHIGKHVVKLTHRPERMFSAVGAVVLQYGDGRIEAIGRKGLKTRLLALDATGPAVVNPAGHLIAWQSSTLTANGRVTVAIRSIDSPFVRDGAVWQTFPAEPTCCDNPFELEGFVEIAWPGRAQEWALLGSLPTAGQTWEWRFQPDEMASLGAGGFVRRVRGLGGRWIVRTGYNDVVLSDDNGHTVVGRVIGRRFSHAKALVDLPYSPYSFSDPWQRFMLFATSRGIETARWHDALAKSKADPTERLLLSIPTAYAFDGLRWEDRRHVVFGIASGGRHTIVRCQVDSGDCEIAADVGRGLLLPE